MSLEAIAEDPAVFAADRECARESWTALRRYAPDDGACVNFEHDTDAARIRAS